MDNNAPRRQSFVNSWQNHTQDASLVPQRRNRLEGSGQNGMPTASVATRHPPKKAKKRRKCFVPVGPAGVWFQAQDHPGGRKSDTDQHNEQDHEFFEHTAASSQPESHSSVSFCSPAWTAAQCSLGISTPSLPPYWPLEQKYDAVKSHIPSEYLLLNDVLQGHTDWVAQRRLLVQVSSIQSVTANDHLWTAILEDETGTTLTAWIQPELVRKEQQNNKWVRVGNVWLLEGCTIYLIPQTEGWDRILLVDESNLCEMWTPTSADSIPTKEYIAWMEARNLLSSSLLEHRSDSLLHLGDAERAEWAEMEEESNKDNDDDDEGDDEDESTNSFASSGMSERLPRHSDAPPAVRHNSEDQSPKVSRLSHSVQISGAVSLSVPYLAEQVSHDTESSLNEESFVSQQSAQEHTKRSDVDGSNAGREAAVVTPMVAQTTRNPQGSSTGSETYPGEEAVLKEATQTTASDQSQPNPKCKTVSISEKSSRHRRKRKIPLPFTEEVARHLQDDSFDEVESSVNRNSTVRTMVSDELLVEQTSTGPSMLFCHSAFEGIDVDLDG